MRWSDGNPVHLRRLLSWVLTGVPTERKPGISQCAERGECVDPGADVDHAEVGHPSDDLGALLISERQGPQDPRHAGLIRRPHPRGLPAGRHLELHDATASRCCRSSAAHEESGRLPARTVVVRQYRVLDTGSVPGPCRPCLRDSWSSWLLLVMAANPADGSRRHHGRRRIALVATFAAACARAHRADGPSGFSREQEGPGRSRKVTGTTEQAVGTRERSRRAIVSGWPRQPGATAMRRGVPFRTTTRLGEAIVAVRPSVCTVRQRRYLPDITARAATPEAARVVPSAARPGVPGPRRCVRPVRHRPPGAQRPS